MLFIFYWLKRPHWGHTDMYDDIIYMQMVRNGVTKSQIIGQVS
jgi:hypothetical protein